MAKYHYDDIDGMFSEVYLYNSDGHEFVCIQTPGGPSGSKQGMMFYAINGAYYDIIEWDEVKIKGERIV